MSDLALYILAVFLPPVAVVIKRGCGCAVLLNLLLDCLGWIPGVIRKFSHALPRGIRLRGVLYGPGC